MLIICESARTFSCGKIAGVTSPPTDPAGTQHAGIRDAKRAVRDRVLAARDSLAAETRHAASVAIATTLEARPDFRAARVVLLTLPFGSEWDARSWSRRRWRRDAPSRCRG